MCAGKIRVADRGGLTVQRNTLRRVNPQVCAAAHRRIGNQGAGGRGQRHIRKRIDFAVQQLIALRRQRHGIAAHQAACGIDGDIACGLQGRIA